MMKMNLKAIFSHENSYLEYFQNLDICINNIDM